MHYKRPFRNRLRHALSGAYAGLGRRLQRRFYLYLAVVFTLFAVADTAFLHLTANMRQTAFDTMVRYRVVVPKPDPDIVIVDINEASLAAMAKDYGRWPWPRQVLGEFLEHLEQQQPKAVVFDILFSDPDIYNRDSDAYFDAAIAATHNTFFPLLRLDPASDALSQVKPAMIPGVVAIPGAAKQDATVAVVLPQFQAALAGGRLGLHNIYPDPDGIAREYLVYRDDYGWKLPSLPARVASELGYPAPEVQRMMLNWRGQPFTYRYASFSDVFGDMTSQHKRRSQNEFTGKIVIIGSTAPSLFDIKPTPVSRLHPGVEIMATAIDNLKHGDYLRFPEARTPYLLLTLIIIWATAWGFYRDTGRARIDRLFGASQFILLGISYASINFSTTYINLTGPVTVALAYFTVARIYATATGRALESSVVRASVEQEGELRAFLLLIRLGSGAHGLSEGVLEKIRLGLANIGSELHSVEIVKGRQKGVWALFENTFAVSWVMPAQDEAGKSRVAQDAEAIIAALPQLLRKMGADAENGATWYMHEGLITGGSRATDAWRTLFAQALLHWAETERG
jgi:CHASE2 domain-containing sensor protein